MNGQEGQVNGPAVNGQEWTGEGCRSPVRRLDLGGEIRGIERNRRGRLAEGGKRRREHLDNRP